MSTLRRSVAFALTLTLSSLLAAQEVELRWKYNAGDVLRYRTTLDQEVHMAMLGDKPAQNKMGFVLRQEVKAVSPEGVASIELRYEALRMELTGISSLSYDSTRTGEAAKQNDPAFVEAFAPVLETKLQLEIDPTGHVTQIKGVDELMKRVAARAQSPMAAQVSQVLSEDRLRKLMEIGVLPPRPIRVGETWTHDVKEKVPMLGTIQVVTENTLLGTEERHGEPCARIGSKASASLESPASEDSQPLDVAVEVSEISGTWYFATDSGRLLEYNSLAKMAMRGTPSGASGGATETGLEVTVEAHHAMRLLGPDEPAFE